MDPTQAAASALANTIQTTAQTPAAGSPDGTRVWATVTAVVIGPPPTVTLLIAGSTTASAGISYLSGYNPVVGDTVMCEYWGSDLVVYGTVATAAEPSTLELLYPVGEVYFSLLLATAAAVKARLGFGTWTAWGAGTVLGLRGGAFGASGGASTVTLSAANIPSSGLTGSGTTGTGITGTGTTGGHTHTINGGGEYFATTGYTSQGQSGSPFPAINNYALNTDTSTDSIPGLSIPSLSVSVTISGGSSTAFNIIPPYTALYGWLRTA